MIGREVRGLVAPLYRLQYRIQQWVVGHMCRLAATGRRGTVAPAVDPAPRRVLIVMTGLLGDTVMSIPALAEARRLWPQAEITVLGQPHNCELLRPCPLVDRIWETRVLPFSWIRRGEVRRLTRRVREEGFDLGIILLGDQFASLLARAAVPIRVGVQNHPLSPCLTHIYDAGSPRTWGPQERLNALRSLGFAVLEAPPRVWVDEKARASLHARIPELRKPYIVLHPFGSMPHQWWPTESVRAFLASPPGGMEGCVVLVGGPDARAGSPAGHGKGVIDTTGQLGVAELVAALAGADLVVSTDSGPFHIAAALGRPVIGLFRARRPEHAGRYPNARVLFGEDPLCLATCAWDRCAVRPCRQLAGISADAVWRAARAVLGRRPEAGAP